MAFVVEHADVTTNGNDRQACQQRVLPTEPLSQPKVVHFFNQMILVYSEKDKKLVVIKVPISDYMNVWDELFVRQHCSSLRKRTLHS